MISFYNLAVKIERCHFLVPSRPRLVIECEVIHRADWLSRHSLPQIRLALLTVRLRRLRGPSGSGDENGYRARPQASMKAIFAR